MTAKTVSNFPPASHRHPEGSEAWLIGVPIRLTANCD